MAFLSLTNWEKDWKLKIDPSPNYFRIELNPILELTVAFIEASTFLGRN